MTIQGYGYPDTKPTLAVNFARTKRIDPRIRYSSSTQRTYFDEDGIIRLAPAGVARFTHDPLTGESLGILTEAASTNVVPNSTTPETWSLTDVNRELNAAVAPDGTVTAAKITANGAVTRDHYVTFIGSVHRGLYVKDAGARYVAITYNIVNRFGAIFDLQQGVRVSLIGDASPSASIERLRNGWYRIALAVNSPSGIYFTFQVIPYNAYPSLGPAIETAWPNDDPTAGIYMWGPQAEFDARAVQGDPPLVAGLSSYIPTSGISFTRTADLLDWSGLNFSNQYNQTEGTILLESFYNANVKSPGSPVFWHLKKGSGTGWDYGLLAVPDRKLLIRVDGNGGHAFENTSMDVTDSAKIKIALAYDSAVRRTTVNSIQEVLGAPYTPNNVYSQLLLGRAEAWNQYGWLNRPISRLVYWPTRLSDASLLAISR